MQNLDPLDVARVRRLLPPEVLQALKSPTVYLAGGFIRDVILGESPSDVDLFVDLSEGVSLGFKINLLLEDLMGKPGCTDKAEYEGLPVEKEVRGPRGFRLFRTCNAVTIRRKDWRWPVQIITRWTGTPTEQLALFDWTVCQAAIFHDMSQKGPSAEEPDLCGTCSDRFYQDVAARRLIYTRPTREEEAGGSFLRMLKMLRRGYSAPLDSAGAVIGRMLEGKVTTGMTACEIGNIATGLMVEVDPRTVLHNPLPREV